MGKEEHRDENRDDTSAEKSGGSSRLGREAKIGVTVIIVLLAALGVAVAMRLSKSGEDDKQVVAADDGKHNPGGPSKIESLLKGSRSKPFGGGSSSAIVVSPSPVSNKPPRSTPPDFEQWKIAADRNDPKPTSGSAVAASSPPLMLDPPKPVREDRHDRYALDPPVPKDVDEMKSPAPPPYREDSHYEHPTPPPGAMRGGSSYSIHAEHTTPAMTVSQPMTVGQYDGGNYRGESPEPRHPRHSAPTPRYNDAPRRDDGKYEVQPNDSYWTISEKLYGTGAYFKALAQHNRGKQWDDDRLQPGVLILAPAVAELEKSYPDLCPKPSRREALQSQAMSRASMVSGRNQSRGGRTYTVAEGDTLFNIARYELGKASRWAEIYDLNREVLGKDFNYLTPGTQLAMPEGEKSDVIAQPLESGYRR